MSVCCSPLERKLRLLISLTEDDTNFIRKLEANCRQVPARAELVRQGEPYRCVILVQRGWLMRFKTLPDGRRQIVNFALPGDIIGLYANLFELADHSATALTEATVCEFDAEMITELFQRFPKLAAAFVWFGAREEAMLAERNLGLGRRTALERTAHMLLELLRRLQIVHMAEADRFLLPVSQEVIADTLGLSLVHVNRTLRRLREHGLVEIDGQTIYLRDLAGLQSVADFDELYLYFQPMPRRMQRRLSA